VTPVHLLSMVPTLAPLYVQWPQPGPCNCKPATNGSLYTYVMCSLANDYCTIVQLFYY
jgi:hypothetical protein